MASKPRIPAGDDASRVVSNGWVGGSIDSPDLIILFLGDRTATIMPQDIALVREYR